MQAFEKLEKIYNSFSVISVLLTLNSSSNVKTY